MEILNTNWFCSVESELCDSKLGVYRGQLLETTKHNIMLTNSSCVIFKERMNFVN